MVNVAAGTSTSLPTRERLQEKQEIIMMPTTQAPLKSLPLNSWKSTKRNIGVRFGRIEFSQTGLFLICLVWLSFSIQGIAGVGAIQQGVAQQVAAPETPLADLLTVAESSDYTATSTSAQVEEFIDVCASQARHVTKFVFGSTVEGRDLIGVHIAGDFYGLGDQDQRSIVLLVANIHSGECAPKEALLMLLRELSGNVDHPWLDDSVIVMVPNYCADSNDRFGLYNRPGQIGPDQGMGRRENAQELDLNRDFMKIEAPETRALVKLMNKIQPHVFVDCHTTNGSRHRYCLTYDIPHNPATSESLRHYMRESMMPTITESMAAKGQDIFYYGNFNREQDRWNSYGYQPRYSTEYGGLRGCLSILSEAYSYISYRDRIFATKDFIESILDYASDHRDEIKSVVSDSYRNWITMAEAQPQRIKFSLAATATAFPQKFSVKGFQDGQPHDYEVDYIGNFVSTKATPLPFAYILPPKFSRITDRLLMHGVVVEELSREFRGEVEVDTIVEVRRSSSSFQKHQSVSVEATRKILMREIPNRSLIVRTNQPLGRLAAYLLESGSDDGFVYWNFLDQELVAGQEYPILRIPDPIQMQLNKVDRVDRTEKITFDHIDGPFSLIDDSPPPKWLGRSNLIEVSDGRRQTILDAATLSYTPRRPPAFSTNVVSAALARAGVDRRQINPLLRDPIVAENRKYAVLSNESQALVYWLQNDENSNPILDLTNATPPSTLNSGSPVELLSFNHDETELAFVTPAGLHLLNLESRKIRTVAAPTEQHLIGKLDWVYQEELYGRGNFQGYWWNPTSNQVAFLAFDETDVPDFTLMDLLPIKSRQEVSKYPKAGDPLPIVRVGVTRSADNTAPSLPSTPANDQHPGSTSSAASVTWVSLDQYAAEELLISRVTWSPDGERLLIQVQNREQTWLDLIACNRDGSQPQKLFRDHTVAWIKSPGDPVFLNSGDFLWLSPRDGINRVYRYQVDGTLIGAIADQDWEVRELFGVDPENRYAYFSGTQIPTELHGYRVDLQTQQVQRLTSEAGTHQLDFSHDYSLFLDRFSNSISPPETRIHAADGTLLRHWNVRSDDRLEYLDIAQPEFLKVSTADGLEMDAMLIKPTNFNRFSKYPILLHVYAGPQSPRVRNRFDGAFYLWHQMLAQKGYVVMVLDNRSASFRNTRDAWPIHRQLGVEELNDILAGTDWLKQQTWVDPQRIGIWGWSYGGYMTLYAMTRSDDFKVGIAGAPVTDWLNYDAIYTERYMGLPQTNLTGYQASSVIERAAELSGRLLLIHGTIDDNVHLNNSMQLTKALQDSGILFDLMLYPNNRHSVRDPQQIKHLRRVMTEFILKNL